MMTLPDFCHFINDCKIFLSFQFLLHKIIAFPKPSLIVLKSTDVHQGGFQKAGQCQHARFQTILNFAQNLFFFFFGFKQIKNKLDTQSVPIFKLSDTHLLVTIRYLTFENLKNTTINNITCQLFHISFIIFNSDNSSFIELYERKFISKICIRKKSSFLSKK